MAEIILSYHPIGTRGFVADALKEVREVVVEDVMWQLRYATVDGVVHTVHQVDGPDLWHDRYSHRRIHETREAAAAELKAEQENWARIKLVPAGSADAGEAVQE